MGNCWLTGLENLNLMKQFFTLSEKMSKVSFIFGSTSMDHILKLRTMVILCQLKEKMETNLLILTKSNRWIMSQLISLVNRLH